MSSSDGIGLRPDDNAEDEIAPEGHIELLSPPLFSRVQEPDGSVYDIEILAHNSGARCRSRSPVLTDNNLVSAVAEDAHRLAACTLIIGAPIGKNKGRMIDGKIENLWLKDEDTANRLDNIRMLSTLLSYVQKFCGSHEVPHLSSIQTSEHPVWLRNFFKVAGFDRCHCLKPENSGQRYRACLQLDSFGNVVEREVPDNVPGNLNEKINANLEEQSMAVAGTGLATPTKEVRSSSKIKNTDGPPSKISVDLVPANPLTQTQAMEWLSQNQEILTPHDPSKLSDKPVSELAPSKGKAISKAPTLENGKLSANDADKSIRVKRKLGELMRGLESGEGLERSTRIRTSQSESVGDQKKTKADPKPAKTPVARYSSTNTIDTTRSKETQSSDNASMTDALLAQCDKTKSISSPKQIKKEVPVARTEVSPPSDSHSRLSTVYPPGNLTCWYWKHQGGCKHRDEDCMYAHFDTGAVARPPSVYKKGYSSSFYNQHDLWSDVNGINIKGNGHNGSAAPTAPKYDSWRP